MSSQNRWLILAIVSSALFLIVMDMTVLFTALPRLTHDLAATASEKLWIVNAYGLVVAGLLPGAGTLGDRLGHRNLFLGGLVVFGTASLVAAFSATPAILIAARVLLAIGAAMMMPATLSIIRLTFTDSRERAFAIGIWAAVASGGAALGPVVGGVLLEYFWWGSVFLINVPVILIALIATFFMVPARPGNKHLPWDFIGSLQIMAVLVGFAYAIKEVSKREASLQSAGIALAIGLVALVLFVRRQRNSAHPLIDFGLFGNPRFSSGVATALVTCFALVGVELVFSQRLQLVLGLSPLQAGLYILPIPLASFIAGPLAGLAVPRVGIRTLLSIALSLAGLGIVAIILTHNASTWALVPSLALLGLGIGAAMSAASSTIMESAPKERAGMAASVEEVSYELGGAMGVAILGSIISAIYTAFMVIPAGFAVPDRARDSIDEALLAAESLPPAIAANFIELARAAFDNAFIVVMLITVTLLWGTAIAIWWAMRDKPVPLAGAKSV